MHVSKLADEGNAIWITNIANEYGGRTNNQSYKQTDISANHNYNHHHHQVSLETLISTATVLSIGRNE